MKTGYWNLCVMWLRGCRSARWRGYRMAGPRGRGFALISTLVIIAMLTVMVTAFLQSARMDRLTSRSYLGMLRARLVSDAALALALDRLQILRDRPHAAVYTLDNLGEPAVTPAPYLFLARAELDDLEAPTKRTVVRYPLFSSAFLDPDAPVFNAAHFKDPSALPVATAGLSVTDRRFDGSPVVRPLSNPEDIWVDMNRPDPFDDAGVIGLVNADGNRLRIPVNWIYVRDHDGRVIGRYAYWMDDECSKVDLRTAGNTRGAGGKHERGHGIQLDEAALEHFTDSAIGLSAPDIAAMLAWRSASFPVPLSLEHFRYLTSGDPATAISDDIWGKIKGHITIYSRHDDRAPDGKRKLALNQVVTDTTDPVKIQRQVEAIRDAIDEVLPTFWTRAFSSPDPLSLSDTEKEKAKRQYLTRIAANLRDTIDTDRVATVILNDGTALAGVAPTAMRYAELGGTIPTVSPVTADLPIAVGKENVPFLNEYTVLMKVFADVAAGSDRNITVWPVHYVEFFNPTGQAINYADLGPNPFVRISERAPWSVTANSGAQPTLRPADIIMRLPTTFSIPAGGYAVLTTDSPPFLGSQTDFIDNGVNRYVLTKGTTAGRWQAVNAGGQTMPMGAREYYLVKTAHHSKNRYRVKLIRPAGYGQNNTRLVFGNDDGVLDVALRIYQESDLYMGRGVRLPTMLNTNVTGNKTTNPNNGGSGARFRRGTPTSNAEIQVVQANNKTVWSDGLGAYGDKIFSGGRMTQGAMNFSTDWTLTTWQQAWPEFTTEAMGNFRGRNQKITNLGQLGFLFDPARHEREHRGGSRTLRIGQSDDPKLTRVGVILPDDQSSDSKHRLYTGGRGSDDPSDWRYSRNAWQLFDVFRITEDDVETLRGRINPNAVARGARMLGARALFHNFQFEKEPSAGSSGSAIIGGKTLRQVANQVQDANRVPDLVPVLLTRMREELKAGRPFLNEGDLSRLDLFHTGMDLAGVDMSKVSDAGREELLRRSANLMTTLSLSYSVHIIAQSGRFIAGDRFDVTGTVVRRAVVELVPTYPAASDVFTRVKPESWQTRVLIDEFK